MITDKLSQILPYVSKPLRYTGGEVNSVVKDHSSANVKWALCYPDGYDVGMSNLGLKILYSVINSIPDALAERVFAPFPDMESALIKHKVPLYSLETHTPIKNFDIVAFSLQYELTYTGIATVLNLAGIPFKSSERTSPFPIVIAGGPSSVNPEPVADFFDAVLFGDGESAVIEITDLVRELKKWRATKEDVLKELSKIPGIYVPSFYRLVKSPRGFLIPDGKKVVRRVERDPFSYADVDSPVVPSMGTVQNRAVVELVRGCPRMCRFCSASSYYRPPRERNPEEAVSLAYRIVKNTGYREVSFSALSVSDYTALGKLVSMFREKLHPLGVSFSLPSLRLDSFTLPLAESVAEIRKSTLTFAVETGSQKLRNIIGKDVDEDDLFRTLEYIKKAGWRKVKLYFMVGLPFAYYEDEVRDIAELVKRIKKIGLNINTTISTFIPKPFTPFERERQIGLDESVSAMRKARREMKRYAVVRFHSPEMSFLEGIFSRGDRKLFDVVVEAWSRGARFDGWGEFFRFDAWLGAFEKFGIDPDGYRSELSWEEPVPWQILVSRTDENFLRQERENAKKGLKANNCFKCPLCGVCGKEVQRRFAFRRQSEVAFDEKSSSVPSKKEIFAVAEIVFSREGSAKFISAKELQEVVERALFRADLPLKFTEGFNPRPKMSSAVAVPTGFESRYDLFEVGLTKFISSDEILSNLKPWFLPDGMKVVSVSVHRRNKLTVSKRLRSAVFSFAVPDGFDFQSEWGRFEKEFSEDVRFGGLMDCWFENGRVVFRLDLKRKRFRPSDFIGLFMKTDRIFDFSPRLELVELNF